MPILSTVPLMKVRLQAAKAFGNNAEQDLVHRSCNGPLNKDGGELAVSCHVNVEKCCSEPQT